MKRKNWLLGLFLLAAMGCDSIQGYLIARPQSLNQLLAFLEDEGGRRSYG